MENLFDLSGNSNDLIKKISILAVSEIAKKEIENIIKITKNINLKLNDQIIFDFTEFDDKNYHDGIKFTFFAKNVRGEIASGGRYKINSHLKEETAVGFTCFMDTVLRASSFDNMSKKILIPFNTKLSIKNNLIKKNYIIFSFLKILQI